MSLAMNAPTGAALPLRGPFAQRAERWFFIFVLLYAAGALVQLVVQGPVPLRGVMTQDSEQLRAIWAGCYAVFVAMALYHLSLYGYVLRTQPLLLALCGFMLLSAIWSADPMTSLQLWRGRRGAAPCPGPRHRDGDEPRCHALHAEMGNHDRAAQGCLARRVLA